MIKNYIRVFLFYIGFILPVVFATVGFLNYFSAQAIEKDYIKENMKFSEQEMFLEYQAQLKMININLGNIKKELSRISSGCKNNE